MQKTIIRDEYEKIQNSNKNYSIIRMDEFNSIKDYRDSFIPHMFICGEHGSGKTTLIKRQIKIILETTDDEVVVFPEDEFEYEEFLKHKNFSIINKTVYYEQKYCLKKLLDNSLENKVWTFFDNYYFHLFVDREFNSFIRRARKKNITVTLCSSDVPTRDEYNLCDLRTFTTFILCCVRIN